MPKQQIPRDHFSLSLRPVYPHDTVVSEKEEEDTRLTIKKEKGRIDNTTEEKKKFLSMESGLALKRARVGLWRYIKDVFIAVCVYTHYCFYILFFFLFLFITL